MAWAEVVGPRVSEPEEKLGHWRCSVSHRQGKLLLTGFQDAAQLGLKSMFFLYTSQYFCLRGSIISQLSGLHLGARPAAVKEGRNSEL